MWDSEFTHTRPWPPPGAGGLAAVSALRFFADVLCTAAGVVAAELLGLNRSPIENLPGDGEAFASASVFLRLVFAFEAAAGEAAAAAGLVAALGSAFLRPRFGFGAAAGDSAGAGDAVVALVDAAVSAFFRLRCFAGDSPGVGD